MKLHQLHENTAWQPGQLVEYPDDKGTTRRGSIMQVVTSGPLAGMAQITTENGSPYRNAVPVGSIVPYRHPHEFKPGEPVRTQFTSGPDQQGTIIQVYPNGTLHIATATGRSVDKVLPWLITPLNPA